MNPYLVHRYTLSRRTPATCTPLFCLWFKHVDWIRQFYVHSSQSVTEELIIQAYWYYWTYCLSFACLFSIKFNTCGSHHNTNIVNLQMFFFLFLDYFMFKKLCKYPSSLTALLWEGKERNSCPDSQIEKWGRAIKDLLKVMCPVSDRNWIRTHDLPLNFVFLWVSVFLLQNQCDIGQGRSKWLSYLQNKWLGNLLPTVQYWQIPDHPASHAFPENECYVFNIYTIVELCHQTGRQSVVLDSIQHFSK